MRPFHWPRGASTSILSPTFLPSTARPTGDSGETPPTLEMSTRHLLAVLASSSTLEPTVTTSLAAAASSSITSALCEPRLQNRDAALEQALLVLRRVVLEVLGEVAVAARDRDRLDDLLPARPLELGELRHELIALGERQLLPCWSLIPASPLVAATARAAAATAAATARPKLGCFVAPWTANVENWRDDVRRGAIGACDHLLAADALLEVRLALHADVFVDRHDGKHTRRGCPGGLRGSHTVTIVPPGRARSTNVIV